MAAGSGLHIAISAEQLFSIGGLEVANTLFTSFVVTALLAVFLFYANSRIEDTDRPTRFQSFIELVVGAIYGLVDNVTQSAKKTSVFVPFIGSFLIFIALNNWFALLPGVHTIKFTGEPTVQFTDVPKWLNPDVAHASEVVADIELDEHGTELEIGDPEQAVLEAESYEESGHDAEEGKHSATDLLRGANADLNMTLALAIISVFMTQVIGVQFVGLGYFKKYLNFSDPISFFIGLLEILAEISKVVSFAFRLFGNIFAGEVLISVMKFLVPVLIPVPFLGFEIFIGGLQAYVFAMLSLVFFNMATSSHH